ncbi:FadR/GntR family transcriptional regulator [Amycolatopsis pithecellobii]|uniref:FadR/GntR family transcriptional regulator n=1 Tax=Amycolatopsis pithecellobii TaxID=664692 RepID=UPI0012B78C59|nr:GntR family transcriptional regulator [Amycolatopsis pithecellobii]
MTERSTPAAWPNGSTFQLRRTRRAGDIVQSLRDQIARGELPRGSKLPSERALGEQFGVSGPTVREATRALAAMGLVESRHGEGTFVTARPEDALMGALATIAMLEGATIQEILDLFSLMLLGGIDSIIAHATDEDIEQLRSSARSILEAGERTELIPHAENFVLSLVRASHRPLLITLTTFLAHMLVALEQQLFPQSDEFWRDWAGRLDPQRAEITDAVAARQPRRLRTALTTYITKGLENLTALGIDPTIKLADPRLGPTMATVVDLTM